MSAIEMRDGQQWQRQPISEGAFAAWRQHVSELNAGHLPAPVEFAANLRAAAALYAIRAEVYRILHGDDPNASKVKSLPLAATAIEAARC